MKSRLRDLVAQALYPVKAHTLPAVCERFGLEPGTDDEAFSSKTRYVMKRLAKLSDQQVLQLAINVVREFPNDTLRAAIERLEQDGRLLTDLTRHHIGEALNPFDLAGKRDLIELLRKHYPTIDKMPSEQFLGRLVDDIQRHAVENADWDNATLLSKVGFLTCSQARLFGFLEDVLHPIRREHGEQASILAALNPILMRDGYCFVPGGQVSGYPIYKAQETTASGSQPADALISEILSTFDEGGVHRSWRKALERRTADSEGAITAAKTLLETVCKHILEDAGLSYGANDDLPKLYAAAAERLNLAPSQHSEVVFKSILGNCQAVVNNLASLRNRLGDSHGQGKQHVKPQARHAELAVNLAGSVAMFLVSTWNARKTQ